MDKSGFEKTSVIRASPFARIRNAAESDILRRGYIIDGGSALFVTAALTMRRLSARARFSEGPLAMRRLSGGRQHGLRGCVARVSRVHEDTPGPYAHRAVRGPQRSRSTSRALPTPSQPTTTSIRVSICARKVSTPQPEIDWSPSLARFGRC